MFFSLTTHLAFSPFNAPCPSCFLSLHYLSFLSFLLFVLSLYPSSLFSSMFFSHLFSLLLLPLAHLVFSPFTTFLSFFLSFFLTFPCSLSLSIYHLPFSLFNVPLTHHSSCFLSFYCLLPILFSLPSLLIFLSHICCLYHSTQLPSFLPTVHLSFLSQHTFISLHMLYLLLSFFLSLPLLSIFLPLSLLFHSLSARLVFSPFTTYLSFFLSFPCSHSLSLSIYLPIFLSLSLLPDFFSLPSLSLSLTEHFNFSPHAVPLFLCLSLFLSPQCPLSCCPSSFLSSCCLCPSLSIFLHFNREITTYFQITIND
ncbi:unnamed protein product [Acanthosepion pharaonis]|uniref:Uncharacterized protein n=1 Tax=Acanthosepion pharaonis TaxID=158019 RepID=A0A812CYV5_ACAPH|nr:unnamed protein product [Sepia pharaonis]